MAKTVYYIRHAKSSWDDLNMRDHDRPLNKRGLRDAPMMAQQLVTMNLSVDQMITSSAKRAEQTAKFFQNTLQIPAKNFHVETNLYHGDLDNYLDGVRTWANDAHESVALFAHNPGMTYLANNYSDDYIDNVPTCGIIVVQYDVTHFADINKHNGQLRAFYYPKMYL